ncbi:uncharacterized protein LOC144664301 [Oculina patagonica]
MLLYKYFCFFLLAKPLLKLNGTCENSPETVDKGCSISADCTKLTCKMDFVGKTVIFTLKVNECDGVSATVGINVPDLNINWSHTFTSDGIIAIPGFTVSMTSIGTAGV